MYFYYGRVSTLQQSNDRQIKNFKAHGYVTDKNVFLDKVQGNIPFLNRPQAVKLIDLLTSTPENKTVVIDSIDRLGRDLIDILQTIELLNSNKINLKALKEGFETLTPDGEINPMAKLLCTIMGSIAELERNKIKERQAEGIQIAKAQGKFKGRKVGSIDTPQMILDKNPAIVAKLKKGLSVRDTAEIIQVSNTTVQRVRKAMKILKVLEN